MTNSLIHDSSLINSTIHLVKIKFLENLNRINNKIVLKVDQEEMFVLILGMTVVIAMTSRISADVIKRGQKITFFNRFIHL